MSIEIIQQRLLNYECKTINDQDNALKEIAQEIALMALSRENFFKVAAFQGGTSLRILWGLERFSEDLDFVLKEPDPHFDWQPYVKNMQDEFSDYGYSLEVNNKTKLDKAVRTAFLKADSTGGILVIKDSSKRKLQIKLEIDTSPPAGSEYELKYLDFPLAFSVQSQNLSSLFASKSHALLCRDYVKGRDWYDFNWYIKMNTPINFNLLNHAIHQHGPWAGQHITVTPEWYFNELESKIKKINWEDAKQDVERFLRPKELKELEVWSQ